MAESYQVLELLGSGGFGKVFRARYSGDGGFEKEVALKVLRSGVKVDEDFAARLRDEARMLAMLRHRCIVQVDRLMQLGDRWVVVMECVRGFDLRAALSAGLVTPRVLLEVLAEVADALHAAWTRPGPHGAPLRLLHRDLKPANLRVTPYGEVKLLDFGIARAEFESREAATANLVMGSPPYMAPERFLFDDSPAADVYSLGVMLYEGIVRRRFGPTKGRRAYHLELLATRMEQLRPLVSAELAQLIERVLDWEPARRPSHEDFQAACRALAPNAGPEGLAAWARRVAGPLEEAPRSGAADLTGFTLVLDSQGGKVRITSEPEQERTPTTWPLPPEGPEDRAVAWDQELDELVIGDEPDSEAPLPVVVEAWEPPEPEPPEQEPPPSWTPERTIEQAAPSDEAPNRRGPAVLLAALAGTGLVFAGLLSRGGGEEAPAASEAVEEVVAAPAVAAPSPLPELPTPAQAEPVVELDEAVEEEPPEEAIDDAPPPAVVPEPVAVSSRPVTKTPSPSTRQATRPSAPARPAGVRVTVTGDAAAVWLQRGTARHALPATVPSGRYALLVDFHGGETETHDEIEVPSSGSLSVSCVASFRTCRVSAD